MPAGLPLPPPTDWSAARAALKVAQVPDAPGLTAGTAAGMAHFRGFCETRLKKYATVRNDPNEDAQSGMSPWVRFGQVGFQRLALDARKLGKHGEGVAAFIEEGVVRRELSDNVRFILTHNFLNRASLKH
jgi:deoxyribodipyrimidine photo-lyase